MGLRCVPPQCITTCARTPLVLPWGPWPCPRTDLGPTIVLLWTSFRRPTGPPEPPPPPPTTSLLTATLASSLSGTRLGTTTCLDGTTGTVISGTIKYSEIGGNSRSLTAQRSSAAGPPASQPAAVVALSVVEEDRSPQDWTYAPAELTTKVGTTPTWTNAGAEGHTVTSNDGMTFDSHNLIPNPSF